MSGWAWLNGRIVPDGEAHVSIWDRGFLYGDGVFETLRVYDGVPFHLCAHLERLHRGIERLAIPGAPSAEQLCDAVRCLVERDVGPEAILRIMVTRGRSTGGWHGEIADGPTVLVVLRPSPLPPVAWYEAGVAAVWCTVPIMQAPWWPSDLKHNNWLPRILAKPHVDAAGAHEGFLRTARDTLAEGLTSNVFVVQDATLRTPPLSAGALPGVTRGLVLRLAGTAGLRACEGDIPAADVVHADEIFLTHAGLGPVAVVTFEGRPVGTGAPGPVWRRLHAAYFAEARR